MMQSNTLTSPISNDISRKHNMSPPPSFSQSCLDPLLVEPRVLMHQLIPPNPSLSLPWPHKISDIHPSSISFLSTQSLEMCTESLGCETGSGINDHELEEWGQSPQPQRLRPAANKVKRHSERSCFPPPLTSISGSRGVQVQTHREGGRLVMKAVSSSSSCRFQAERGNGRLRLSLLIDCGGGEEEEEEEVDGENVDGDDSFGGHVSAEWASSRCNGDGMSSMKRLQSLPFCVAGIS